MAEVIDLAGMLLPFRKNNPVIVKALGSTDQFHPVDHFLPVFDNGHNLVVFMIAVGAIYDKIKKIDPDVPEFLQSLVEWPVPLKLMVNPHFVEGKLQYSEIDPVQLLLTYRAR